MSYGPKYAEWSPTWYVYTIKRNVLLPIDDYSIFSRYIAIILRNISLAIFHVIQNLFLKQISTIEKQYESVSQWCVSSQLEGQILEWGVQAGSLCQVLWRSKCVEKHRFQATRHHIQGWHQSLGSSGAEMSLEVPYIRTGGSDYTLSHQPHWRQTALPLHIPHSLVKIKHDLGQSSSLVKGYFCESRLNCRLPAVKNPWSREYSGSRRKFWMVYNSIHIDAHHCFYSNKQY